MSNAGWQEDKEKLEQILGRDEFTAYERGENRNVVLEWLEKMWNKLFELFPDISVPPGTPKVLAYTLVAVLLILVASAIVWLVRNIVVMRRAGRRHSLLGSEELGNSSAMLMRKARDCAADGDYREAVRHAFLAQLLLMHERDWIRAEKWKTNLEYVDELSERKPAAVAAFTRAARLFEGVYYGGGEAGEREYVHMTELLAPYWTEEAADD